MEDDIFDKATRIFSSRKTAYERLFDKTNPDASIVLADLARFCRATESTFKADDRLHAVLEGRREVWLRIQKYINMTQDELFELNRRGN